MLSKVSILVNGSNTQLGQKCDTDIAWKNGSLLACGTESQGMHVRGTQIYRTKIAQVFQRRAFETLLDLP